MRSPALQFVQRLGALLLLILPPYIAVKNAIALYYKSEYGSTVTH